MCRMCRTVWVGILLHKRIYVVAGLPGGPCHSGHLAKNGCISVLRSMKIYLQKCIQSPLLEVVRIRGSFLKLELSLLLLGYNLGLGGLYQLSKIWQPCVVGVSVPVATCEPRSRMQLMKKILFFY